MFKKLHDDGAEQVAVTIDGRAVQVPAGETVAAAALMHGLLPFRTSAVSDAPRGPYCMMGACFDCLVEIDGVANRQACQVRVAEGMTIRRQDGAGPAAP